MVGIKTVILGEPAVVHALTNLERNIHLALALGTLGVDKDDAIGTTVTIKRARSGVLEDRHRFYIRRVYVGD